MRAGARDLSVMKGDGHEPDLRMRKAVARPRRFRGPARPVSGVRPPAGNSAADRGIAGSALVAARSAAAVRPPGGTAATADTGHRGIAVAAGAASRGARIRPPGVQALLALAHRNGGVLRRPGGGVPPAGRELR